MLTRAHFYALASIGISVSACNCDEGLAGLRGTLEVVPDPVIFGDVPVGAEKQVTLSLRNTGTFRLNIESFSTTGPFIAPTTTTSVAAGATIEVTVGFRPPAIGPHEGTLTITTDLRDSPSLDVPLSGTGIEAAVVVEPLVVDFGEVLWDRDTEPQSRTVTVTNPGTDSFDLTAVSVSDDGAGAYTVDPMDVVKTFAPGESATFDVMYMPNQMGPIDGAVRIETTAPQGEAIMVTLKATAVGPVLDVCATVDGEAELCRSAGAVPRLDFGLVDLNTSKAGHIRVINIGDRDMSVQGQVQGPADEFTLNPDPMGLGRFSLMPGAERRVDVTYMPANYEFDTIIIGFGTDAAENSFGTVRAEGRPPKATINVVPEGVTFTLAGSVPTGQSTVRIYNCGETPLILMNDVVINQTSGMAGAFSLMNAPMAATTIQPMGDCMNGPGGAEFTVVFAPGIDGTYSADIPITTNDPIQPSLTVEVMATKRP